MIILFDLNAKDLFIFAGCASHVDVGEMDVDDSLNAIEVTFFDSLLKRKTASRVNDILLKPDHIGRQRHITSLLKASIL